MAQEICLARRRRPGSVRTAGPGGASPAWCTSARCRVPTGDPALARDRRLVPAWARACSLPGAALAGCGLAEAPILDPKGPITLIERDLLFTAFGLMLIVVIPVFAAGLRVRVALPGPASKHDVYAARLGLLGQDRRRRLAGAGADRDRDRHAGLGLHAQARSLPRTLAAEPAARGPGRGAGLEVAVPLPRAEHRGGQRAGVPERDGR